MELLEPILAIGEQEMQNLVLAVVEAETVPSRMLTTVALIEVLTGIASEVGKAFHLVLHSMAVHDVHNDGKAHAMRLIHE